MPVDRTCPICDGREVDVLHQQRFVLPESHPLRDGYAIVCCRSCGFVYADTVADQAAYDAYYATLSKYEDNTTVTGAGVTAWDAERLERTARLIAGYLADGSARVLDIGCANGGLLAAMKAIGFGNLCGVDPSPGCAAYVRDHLGIEAYAGVLDPLPGEVGTVDAVALAHVLEHVRDLRPALAAVGSVMKPGAIIYVEIPDAARYRDHVYSPFQDFNTEHINHFSQALLQRLLATCGFEPINAAPCMLFSAPSMPYPACYAVGRYRPEIDPSAWMVKDDSLRISIEDYIRISADLLATIDRRIVEALDGVGPILVWGTGQLAMKLLAETSLKDAEIAAFVDGNPINQGKLIQGIPVLSPGEIRGMPHPILITSTLHEREIANRIAELGYENRVLTLGDVTNYQG